MTHVGLVHGDSCRFKVKGFSTVFSIERYVLKEQLQGLQHDKLIAKEWWLFNNL